MSPEQMKRQARRLVEEVFTQGDLAVVDELIAHDDVDHRSTPPERTSLAVLKDRVTVLRRAFPDLHLIVEDQIVEADRVVTRSTVRGTHAGGSSDSHPPADRSCSSSSTSSGSATTGGSPSTGPPSTPTACSSSSAHCARTRRRRPLQNAARKRT